MSAAAMAAAILLTGAAIGSPREDAGSVACPGTRATEDAARRREGKPASDA